ncbi:hypothetical protein ACFDHY_06750 [Staphylococcus hyicus]|uniref:hypothetical protein n=1 Tax=Staphylococcus hyicus TaxID=1284 RepID=UPI00211C6420|nr:hypothetical protein [Staphylococcus hyicus]MCQ9301400.1 hypothetical protein [Staphylococcus hyicus]MDP4448316.1 hypothetical protein [Staphylococcus hyicus]MDP4459768.1 hypothetical protein [Staphylococcus hyicus]
MMDLISSIVQLALTIVVSVNVFITLHLLSKATELRVEFKHDLYEIERRHYEIKKLNHVKEDD